MLRPFINLSPVTELEWARNGRFDVMTYSQNNELNAGLYYNFPAISEIRGYLTNSNLNDFHTYSIEWNKFEIKWLFDEIKILTINMSEFRLNLF